MSTMIRAERMVHLMNERKVSASLSYNHKIIRSKPHITINGEKFYLIKCHGDGRCFYHALASVINYKDGSNLSVEDVTYIISKMFPFIRKHWAEDLDVTHAATALKLNIHVWEGVNNMWIRFGYDDNNENVYLYNPSNIHFDALIPHANKH